MLTNGEIEELKAFFASPLGDAVGVPIRAQSYEPHGGGSYDPSTDTKLAGLVLRATSRTKNVWAKMKRVRDELSDAEAERLRTLVYGGRDGIAHRCPRAREAGKRIAAEHQRLAHLEDVHRACRATGILGAMRVLEADARFVLRPLTSREVSYGAMRAIEDGLDVTAETDAMVSAIVATFRTAKANVAGWQRSTRDREEQRRQDFRAELADKKATRDRTRFERALRSAS